MEKNRFFKLETITIVIISSIIFFIGANKSKADEEIRQLLKKYSAEKYSKSRTNNRVKRTPDVTFDGGDKAKQKAIQNFNRAIERRDQKEILEKIE